MASDVNTVTSSTKSDHLIYKSDPLKQKAFISNVVEITREDGKKIVGTVFTIDPVSESIVLMTNAGGTPSLDIVMGHAVHSVELLPDAQAMAVDTVFPSSNAAASLEPEKLEEQRLQVKAWLLKNRLAIEEDGDVLKIKDALQIYPPYGPLQCISDNGIILGKVQELISIMPNDK